MIDRRFRGAALAVALSGAAWGAQATDHNLTLTGSVTQAATSSFDNAGVHFDTWRLGLQGLSPALQLQTGDTVHALIQLDQPLTVPASGLLTAYYFELRGPSYASGSVSTTGHMDFAAGTTTIASWSGACAALYVFQYCSSFNPPANGAMSFDSIRVEFSVYEAPGVFDANSAVLAYTLFSPSAVPEPASAATLLAGLAALGLRRRRQSR